MYSKPYIEEMCKNVKECHSFVLENAVIFHKIHYLWQLAVSLLCYCKLKKTENLKTLVLIPDMVKSVILILKSSYPSFLLLSGQLIIEMGWILLQWQRTPNVFQLTP